MTASLEMGEDEVPFIKIGDEILRLDLEELDQEIAEKARIELRETPEIVEESLEILKTLLKGEAHLEVPLENDFLMKFLRPNKFYPYSTFEVMKKFYKFKYKNPKYSEDLRPHARRNVFEQNIISFIPSRTSSGSRIMVVNIGKNWDTSKISLRDIFKGVLMALEIGMLEPKTQVCGVQVIVDLMGLTFSHVLMFTPSFAKTVLYGIQECAPIRLKGIHVVNQPFIYNILFAIFKPFIGEKLNSRLHLHGSNWESLHEHIPAKNLPVYYGGVMDIPEIPGNLMADILCLYDKEFEECNTIGYKKIKKGGKKKV